MKSGLTSNRNDLGGIQLFFLLGYQFGGTSAKCSSLAALRLPLLILGCIHRDEDSALSFVLVMAV